MPALHVGFFEKLLDHGIIGKGEYAPANTLSPANGPAGKMASSERAGSSDGALKSRMFSAAGGPGVWWVADRFVMPSYENQLGVEVKAMFLLGDGLQSWGVARTVSSHSIG